MDNHSQSDVDEEHCVIVLSVESPSVLYVRDAPLSNVDRDLLRRIEDYSSQMTASRSRNQHASLNDRNLEVGTKYLVFDEQRGQWRRGILTCVAIQGREQRATMFLLDEGKTIDALVHDLLPMPISFASHTPLAKKVFVNGIQPCSLLTDDFTSTTGYGPSRQWDTAAVQYSKRILLNDSSLSDVWMQIKKIDDFDNWFVDFSFSVGRHDVVSYAAHLRRLRYALEDTGNFFNYKNMAMPKSKHISVHAFSKGYPMTSKDYLPTSRAQSISASVSLNNYYHKQQPPPGDLSNGKDLKAVTMDEVFVKLTLQNHSLDHGYEGTSSIQSKHCKADKAVTNIPPLEPTAL